MTLTPSHWPHDVKHFTNPQSLILTAHFASQQTKLNLSYFGAILTCLLEKKDEKFRESGIMRATTV